MSEPTTSFRAFRHAYLRQVARRLKKLLGIGRLAKIEPRVAQLEAMPSRIEELERRIEALEALSREQVGLQYLQLAAGTAEATADDACSQRRAK
jgi:hypothetical protein